MSQTMNYKKLLKLLLISIFLCVSSLSIMFLISSIGVPVFSSADSHVQKKDVENQVYTQQEFDERNQIAMEQIERRIEQLEKSNGVGFDLFIESVRSTSLYYSWIPWFIYAFLFSTSFTSMIRNIPYIFFVPVLLSFLDVFTYLEIFVFGLSIILGVGIKGQFVRDQSD